MGGDQGTQPQFRPNSSPPKISVVLPTHNRLSLLQETLRSVLAQRSVEMEVIVIDDGSTDGTATWLQGFHDLRVRHIYNTTPQGVARARNAGIAASIGDWVAFIDDDDLWAPDKLLSQLSAIDAEPEALWSIVGAVIIRGNRRVVDWAEVPFDPSLNIQLRVLNAVPGGGSGVLVSRKLLDSVGGFRAEFSCLADWDMWLRIARSAVVAPVNRPLVAYRVHADSMSMSIDECDDEYRTLCAVHGLEPTAPYHFWSALMRLQSGRPARPFAQEFDVRSPRRRLLLLIYLAFPSILRFRQYCRARASPPGWREEVYRWLDH